MLLSFLPSVAAGACIGMGCVMFLTAQSQYVGALLFSIGLLFIRLCKFDLYTGAIQKAARREISFLRLAQILAGNAVGILLVYALSLLMGRDVADKAAAVGASVSQLPLTSVLGKAIFCGALMTVATYPDAPLWVSSMCVVAFILSGFRHSVADIFCMPELTHWLTAVVGNLIGGYGLAWFDYMKKKNAA